MKPVKIFILSALSCLIIGGAHANWEYASEYVADGVYTDNGARFVLSLRGGAAYSMAKIKNEIGTEVVAYYYNESTGEVITELYYDQCTQSGGCEGFELAGSADLAALKPKKDYSEISFAAGASIGFTVPYRPQWRLELGWDHVLESEYNQSPMFTGDVTLEGGALNGAVLEVQSSAVQSNLTSDIISVMAFYDFFKGIEKPLNHLIPYIGLGVGYADVKTELEVSDFFGDLSNSADLQKYGARDESGVVQFYKSETNNRTIAGLASLGLSYGFAQNMFMDLGARVMYVPRVKWALSNEDDSRHRDWFSGENLIHINVMLGLRFEF